MDGEVVVEWGVVKRGQKNSRAGVLYWPYTRVGSRRWEPESRFGMREPQAEAVAREAAEDEASRYIGDWQVTVRQVELFDPIE